MVEASAARLDQPPKRTFWPPSAPSGTAICAARVATAAAAATEKGIATPRLVGVADVAGSTGLADTPALMDGAGAVGLVGMVSETGGMPGATCEAATATEAAGVICMTGGACVTGPVAKGAVSEAGAGRTGRFVTAGGPGSRPGATGAPGMAVEAATSELGAGKKPGVPGAAHWSASRAHSNADKLYPQGIIRSATCKVCRTPTYVLITRCS